MVRTVPLPAKLPRCSRAVARVLQQGVGTERGVSALRREYGARTEDVQEVGAGVVRAGGDAALFAGPPPKVHPITAEGVLPPMRLEDAAPVCAGVEVVTGATIAL